MLTTAHTNTWVVHMYDECDSVTPLNQTSSNQFSMRRMYEVKLYKRGLVHVLADDAEDAAWQALELADDDILVDVCPLDETQ